MSTAPLDAIQKLECFIVRVPRDVPYLGPLREGEFINEKGYLIRKGNRSIYPSTDQTVVLKVTAESGRIGWGKPMASQRRKRSRRLSTTCWLRSLSAGMFPHLL